MSYPDDPWYTPKYRMAWLDDHFGIIDDAGDEPRIVGEDGGEPEDQSLARDWSWVTAELQALQRAIECRDAQIAVLIAASRA